MTDKLSNAAELLVLDWLFGVGTPTRPAAQALALDTTTISDTDTGSTITEPATANGYARATTAFDAAAAGVTQNTALESFTNTTSDWGTITDACICDSVTRAAGGIIVYTPLATPRPMTVGDTLEFAAGAFSVTIN